MEKNNIIKIKKILRKHSNAGRTRRQSIWFHPYVHPDHNDKNKLSKQNNEIYKNIYEHIIDQENSLFITKIDRSNPKLQTHFKFLCGELKESDIRLYRLSKRNLKLFLAENFSMRIAEKFTAPLDMLIPYDYNEFCNTFNKLINLERTTLFKIAFNIYDEDEDK